MAEDSEGVSEVSVGSSEPPHDSGAHGAEFTIVLVFTLVLALGAAMRLLARLIKLPFTIGMLLAGIGIGLAIGSWGGEHGLFGLFRLPEDGMVISPSLIIFVFLPVLIFESSFGLDGHLFKKNLGVISLLAGPATLACTVLTAGLMLWLAPDEWAWGWLPALTFGALISATDPVAVVAILKDVRAPKRLGTLIEGESLFNDGVAIVVFTVLVGLLVEGGEFALGDTLVQFVIVVAGGVTVGIVLSYLFSNWIGKTFNDPIVEITLTMVLGYLGMLVAEGMLQVSGVMAIVVSGLWMGGIGRTKISPEVQHFLHRFWGMLVYIANTLIFFLVGLVIATQVGNVTTRELLCILVAYLGIMAIRFAVTFSLLPVFRMIGNPVSKADAAVSSWGGLRGAVSLALALAIASNEAIPELMRSQILVVTAGVVMLTILINGTTVGVVLRYFKLTDPSLPVRVDAQSARVNVLEEVREKISAVATSPGMQRANWGQVRNALEERWKSESTTLDALMLEMKGAGRNQQVARCWREALNVERGAYWEMFAIGALGASAVQILNREIELQLDRIEAGQLAPPESRTPKLESSAERIARKLGQVLRLQSMQYDYLSLLYGICRAENLAATMVLDRFGALKGFDAEVQEEILVVYRRYVSNSNQRVEEMRCDLPALTQSIESAITRRVALNYERSAYESMIYHGLIDEEVARSEMERVQADMKAVAAAMKRIPIPTTGELLSEVPLFCACDEASREKLAAMVEEEVVAPDDYLFEEGDSGDSLYVVVRGAVEVLRRSNGEQELLGVMGGGDLIGEMALLTGARRNASVKATTPVTLLKISKEAFDAFAQTHPEVRERIWDAYGIHLLDNQVRSDGRFRHLDAKGRKEWLGAKRSERVERGATTRGRSDESWLFVVDGKLQGPSGEVSAGALIDLREQARLEALTRARLVWLK